MLADKEVVKQLTIEQKIDFWRRVMQYAKDRNIEFYVMTWNIFTYGVDGKYGITDAIDNPKTIDYFRASVREMFRTYPLLRGIGLTAGENMGDASAYYSGGTDSFNAKENWLFATYGQGVLDAARAEPQRQFRLIHRQHESRAQDIATTFKPVIAQPNVDFVFSFKYAQAHVLSSTTQTFHRGYLESLGDLKTLWTLRNDDALMYRWAAPDFVREFVKNIPYEKSQGYYFGSDMWVWGREFLARDPKLTATAGDRQTLAALPAVGTAGLRPDARQRTYRRARRRGASPASMRRKFLCAVAGRLDDLSTGHRLSLGGLRLPVVHRSLPQPAGPGQNRERLSQRGDLHQSARSSGHEQHHDSGLRRRGDRGKDAARHHATTGRGPDRRAARAACSSSIVQIKQSERGRDDRGISAPR